MNKKQAQEKLLMEYLNHVKNLKDEKGQNLVVIPSNFDAIVEVAVDQRKAQDDLLEKGLIEEGDDLMDESNIDKLIDNMIENQEGQKKGKV